ncbi:uncharacterized protein LOC114607972 [Podarcis muralis]
MPEQQQSRPQLRENQCNMTDIMQRIALSKPPVNKDMYNTLYTKDYIHYDDYHYQVPTMDASQMLKLEAQLKAKEFHTPVEPEPVKYVEAAGCQEVRPPYPMDLGRRLTTSQAAPPPFQQVQEDPQVCHLLPKQSAVQKMEAERLAQQADACIPPDQVPSPCICPEQGQNWSDYQQFLLETQRATQMQLREIKKSHVGSTVFQPEVYPRTEPSTYQRDYVPWPRLRSGFCSANRNFSNLVFDDGYYTENPWVSEYMDNYNIFLKKLNWKNRNPVSSFCSAVKPVTNFCHRMPSQTPIAVNTAP